MGPSTLQKKLAPAIRKGDTQTAIDRIGEPLRKLAAGPFHIVLDLEFTNDSKKVAALFDRFVAKESKRYEVAAIYTETNGFDINPDCWFFNLFAFKAYGGHKNHDWLGEWDSEDCPEMTLKGMESLQKVYDSDAFRDKKQAKACDLCSLMVVAKFQELIRRSVPLMKKVNVPVLATSHDSDFIAEFRADDNR